MISFVHKVTDLYAMQPERLSGLTYTIRSDIWSTGITLLELVQNRFPFPSDLAQIELMMYITQNEVNRGVSAHILRCGLITPCSYLHSRPNWRTRMASNTASK